MLCLGIAGVWGEGIESNSSHQQRCNSMYSDHIFGTRNCTRNFLQTWLSGDFFLFLTLKLKCWDNLRHIIASQGSLKRKEDHLSLSYFISNYFSGKVLPCNCRINLCCLLFLIVSVLCTSIQKQKLNIKIELILTV